MVADYGPGAPGEEDGGVVERTGIPQDRTEAGDLDTTTDNSVIKV